MMSLQKYMSKHYIKIFVQYIMVVLLLKKGIRTGEREEQNKSKQKIFHLSISSAIDRFITYFLSP